MMNNMCINIKSLFDNIEYVPEGKTKNQIVLEQATKQLSDNGIILPDNITSVQELLKWAGKHKIKIL